MIEKVGTYVKNLLHNFPQEDQLILNNQLLPVHPTHFSSLLPSSGKSIAFLDGGQAEILSAGNFCVYIIRVCALIMDGLRNKREYKHEFYLVTHNSWDAQKKETMYHSTIFTTNQKLIDEKDLEINATDETIRQGLERAPLSSVANISRRFAELAIARTMNADFIILDGTLQPTYKNEEKYLNALPSNVAALAKTSSLLTTAGNNPVILLNKISPSGTWSYNAQLMHFVKLHPHAQHVFRFEGNTEIIPYLLPYSTDALFLGYPYGLILVDRLARISNAEKKLLSARFLLRKEHQDIASYLHAGDAHKILDSLG